MPRTPLPPHRIAALLFAAAYIAGCVAPQPRTLVSGWAPYMRDSESMQVLSANGKSLEEVIVFAYEFDENGGLKPALGAKELVSFARALSPRPKRIFVTIVNDVRRGKASLLKDPAMAHRVLASRDERKKHIRQILEIAKSVDGIDIDYENMDYADRWNFTAFIAALADGLHRQGKALSVTVQSKGTDLPKDKDGKPKKGSAAVDWKAVGRSADVFRIMAYYYHWPMSPPGPTAAPQDVSTLAAYALKNVPKEKLCIALSLWGYDWPSGGKGSLTDAPHAKLLAAARHAAIQRDPATMCPFFRYKEGGVAHTVWFDDLVSIQAKIAAIKKLGIARVSFWDLAAGEPGLWISL